VSLLAGGVSDAAGNLSAAATFDFFVLAADANRDRSVNFDDLVILAQNYGGTGKTFSTGDFNDDGSVGFDDLVMLAQRYGTTLPSTATATAPAGESELASATQPRRTFVFQVEAPVRRPVAPASLKRIR
jgi:hypothetical protein